MSAPTARPSNPPIPRMWRTGRALLVAQLLSGGLGAVAWLIAARTHGAAEVGAALAVVGALTWAGLVGNLGLGSLMIGLLPAARRLERPQLAGVSLATAGLAGGALGLLVIAGLALLGGATTATVRSPIVALAVVAGAAAWAVGVVADQVAIATGRPGLAVVRAATSGSGRLVWLAGALALGSRSAGALVAGWSAAMVLGVAVILVALWSTATATWHRRAFVVTAGPLARRAVRTHHVINILGQTPPMALPVVLAAAGRPVQAAAFGAAWQVASIVGLLSPSVATGLFAAGSADRARSGALSAEARQRVLLVVGVAAGALVVAAPHLLGRIGPEYAAEGTAALRILAVGLLADALANLEVARLRLERAWARAAGTNAAIAATALGGAVLLAPSWGAAGAAAAWFAAQLAGCAVALRHAPTPPRSTFDEDLARVRLAPVGTGERGGPSDPPAGRSAAEHRPGGHRPARHRCRPASWTGVRYGPWPRSGDATSSGGRAS